MTKSSFPKGLKSGREWKEPDRTARIAIIDACVLVQAPLRDTLLRLAEPPGIYQPLWSEDIIVEVKRALERQIGLAPSKTAYLERELRRHFPDSWVTGYEPLIRKMTNDEKTGMSSLPPSARERRRSSPSHKRHFPPAATSRWHVEAVGPAAFLEDLYLQSSPIVIERLQDQAKNLGRSLAAQLNVLAKAVPSFVEIVRKDLKHKGD